MIMSETQQKIKDLIRNIPDFPKKGIMFRDITSLLSSENGISLIREAILEKIDEQKLPEINKIVAIEARGFIIGTIAASILEIPLILARKPGKLPNETLQKKYNLEYNNDALNIQLRDIKKDDNVLIVDDILATGGTAKVVCDIVEALGGNVVACYFLIELDELKGRNKIQYTGTKVLTSIHY